MGIYSSIYSNICSAGVNKKNLWEEDKGAYHCHHIVPRHMGGSDDPSNLCYISIREHIIAHYLLWKIHHLPNDLRAMNMLGAKLTTHQRRIVGIWCKNKGIGFHGATKEQRAQWSKRGAQTQIESKIGIHDPKNTTKYSSIGGKAAMQSPNSAWKFWTTAEGRSIRGKLGAKAIRGRKVMFKPGDSTFCRVKPEKVKEFLEKGYVFGSPIPAWNKGKRNSSTSS